MKRFRGVFVAVVAAVSLVVSGFVPVFGAELGPVAPFEAADLLSARVQASLRDHRVLVGDQLAADSTTWVNPDGSLTTEVFGSPVRVPDVDGKFGWRDLDFTLVFASDGSVIPRSGLLPLHISGGGSASEVAAAGLVSVSVDGTSFGFGWDGALPVPVLVGDTARFVDVLPDVDLVVRLDSTGFEQFFEVKSHPSQTVLDRLRLLVKTKSVAVTPNVSGGFDFTASGQKLASMVDPSVYDSAAGGQVALTDAVDVELVGKVLNLSVDENFFDNPDLVYPVIVDPAVTLGVWFDSYVSSAYPNTDFQSATELLVGSPDGGASKYRSFLNFSSSAWADQDIISAELKLYLNWSWSCSARSFSVSPATAVSGSSRWGAQPTLYGGGVVTKSVAAGYNSSCAATYVATDVTNTVSYLAPIVSGAAGFALKAVNENDSFAWKRFNSTNASTNKPSLKVTYNTYPGAPVAPSFESDGTVSGIPASSSLKPFLSSKAVDADADDVTLVFKTYSTETSTTPLGTLCSVSTPSGVQAGCRPTAALVDGQTYYVRATSSDGSVSSKQPSPVLKFLVVASEPTAPVISCPYVNGYSAGAVPATPVSCTVSTTASPANYRAKSVTVTVSEGVPQTFSTNPDGSSSNSILLKKGSFQHRLLAKASGPSGVQSLETSYIMTFGYGGVISPQSPVTASTKVAISSYGRILLGDQPGLATLQWRELGTTNWVSEGFNLPLTTRSGIRGVYNYEWDLRSQNSASALPAISVPQTLQARICYEYLNIQEMSCTGDESMTITRLPTLFGSGATAAAGPGMVSLTSGAFSTSVTDFSQSIGFESLNVSRSYGNTIGAANTATGLFGPGWSGSVGSSASATSSFSLNVSNSGVVTLYDPEIGALVYKPTVDDGYTAVDAGTRDSKIVLTQIGSSFTATEEDGSYTLFQKDSTTLEWEARCSKDATNTKPVVTEYDSAGFITRVGYGSSGSSCTNTVGLYGMSLTYEGSGANRRLKTVSYFGFNPATGYGKTTLQVTYNYNYEGLLVSVTNNINQTTTSYEYQNITKRLTKITQQGFTPYEFYYDNQGRLTQVKRSSGSVEATYVYDAYLSGNSNKPSLTASDTLQWGQKDAPVYAAAVFDNQLAVSLDANNSPMVTSFTNQWRFADFYFTNSSGILTNTSSFGKTKWLYTATLLDGDNNAYAGFDQDGIEKVLAQNSVDGVGSFDPTDYASKTVFATQINSQEVTTGLYVQETWSPVRTVTLNGIPTKVRTHTSYVYDENAPTSNVYGLVTTQITGLVSGVGSSSTNLVQLSKSVNVYDPLDGASVTGPTSGWILKTPTTVKQFDQNNVLVSETKAVFNQYGQATKTIQPGSDGADGRTEIYTYYSNAPNPTRAECGNKPEWEFLLCYTEYPTTATLPNRHISNYDYRLNATRVDETTPTGIKRTTLSTFLDDNRLYETTIQTPTTTPVTTRNVYDPTTLLQTGTQKFLGSTLQSATQKTFDSFGRQTSYTNSLGETETTTFVPENQFAAGSIQTVTNLQNTTRYIYGSTTEPRALVTGLKIEKSGTNSYLYEYQATYDELGRLTQQSGPNGLYQSFTYTDSNQTASMSYGKTSNNVSTNLFTWVRTYDQYGRVLAETEPDAQETSRNNTYSYDSSGRLTSNETTTATSCNLNSYSYDQAGNRTNQTAGNCINQTATSHSYNSFSQLTNPGYVYDELGRNTLIPAVDAPNPNNGNITLSYNSTDDVTSINQGLVTTTFSYDTETRRLNETSNTVTTTRHYTDSSDNPTWVTENGSNPKTEIYSPSLGTGLNITTTLQGTTKTADIQLHDLRGHTVTTIDLATNITAGWKSYDEFGNPETPTTNTQLINYSSYSQAERATNTSGLILMGARVYNPKTNQFTAPDPITGGNENTYSYPNDPINKSDFTGLWSWENTFDLALTVASFLPIPGIQQIAWIAKGVSLVTKAVKVVGVVQKLSSAVRKIPLVAKIIKPKLVTNLAEAQGQGVYSFVVEGKKYIGRSNDVARRMKEHMNGRWAGKEISNFEFRAMPKKSLMDVRKVEQNLIDLAGGIKRGERNPNLHNLINSIRKG